MTKRHPVLITDTHRGIYFGYLVGTTHAGKTVRLEDARHCFRYWVADGDQGTYGLASHGPAPKSLIGPRVTMTINDVSKIVEVTADATKRWEAATWGE